MLARVALLVPVLSLFTLYNRVANAQQTTSTSCSTYGSNINCTSNTIDYGAQQQRAYEQGQQAGTALGSGLALAMQRHAFRNNVKRYCIAHLGGNWTYRLNASGEVLSSGYCPTEEQEVEEVARKFRSHHKDFIACPENASAMATYLDSNSWNPLEEKSYERAYKELKKDGTLKIYSK